MIDEILLIEYHRQQIGDDSGGEHTDQTRHHEGVVEQVFTYHGRAGTVEVHRCNI